MYSSTEPLDKMMQVLDDLQTRITPGPLSHSNSMAFAE